MSTLIENVTKVTEAHAALKDAIAAKGVAVPDGTTLTDMPALVEQIQTGGAAPSPVGWGRPSDWPRIDLVNIEKTDPDVCYFIVQKPYDTINHGFCLVAYTSDGKPWRMDRISVTADGSSVEAIAGTEQTANSSANIDFQFPEEDQAGTVYAVRVSSPTGANFSLLQLFKPSTAHLSGTIYFISGVVLEAIVHQTSAKYLKFGSGGNGYSGPRHIVYTGCSKGPNGSLFRGLTSSLYLVEFRKGSLMEVVDLNQPAFGCIETILEMDDDVKVLMTTGNTYSTPFVKPDSKGRIDKLGKFIDKATGLPVDWSTVNVSSCFTNCVRLTSVSLPAGFGSAAESLTNCFSFCHALTSVSLPAGFGQNATNVAFCFRECLTLTSLSLPAGFGQNATNVQWCFAQCVSLVSLALPTGFAQNATNTDNCFGSCGSLTDVIGNPNFKTSFSLSGCNNLTHDSLMVFINGLQTVTGKKLTIGSTNLAKLTDDEKKVATDKGWTLA